MDMIFAANPDVKNVGLLYSLSEANSTKPIADAKAYLDKKGISYTEQTANTNDEVITAASSLVADKVDAIFTPTDNVIMAAELAIFKDLAAAGIPHYTGADSFVRNGAFATCGVNYTDLGAQTLIVHMIRTRKVPFIQSSASWPVMLMTACCTRCCLCNRNGHSVRWLRGNSLSVRLRAYPEPGCWLASG